MIGGFAGKRTTGRYNLVEGSISSLDGRYKIPFRAYAAPIVFNPIGHAPDGPRINIMNKIKLIMADGTEATDDDIDILIGADLYWKLVTGKTHLLPGGPIAVETIFGWVLSGELNDNGCNPTSTVMLSSASPTMEEAYQKLQRIIDIESLEYLG